MTRRRLTICVATCDREPRLLALLRSIDAAPTPEGVDADLVVVDNGRTSPLEASADELARIAGMPTRLCREERPGISFARNRGVEEAIDSDWLLFVDDDEVVDPGWLRAHVAAVDRLRADVCAGPVLPTYPPGAPRWAELSGVFDRRRYDTGHQLETAATGNTLVRAAVFRDISPWFDQRLALTGGSDIEFFDRVHEAGRQIIWVDDAVVREEVAPDRLSISWVLRRNYRIGLRQGYRGHDTRRRRRDGLKRLVRATAMVVPWVPGLLLGAPTAVRRAAPAARLAGRAAADFGLEYEEYR